MNQLIEKILEKKFDDANKLFESEINAISERKLVEMRKMVAAKMEEPPFEPDVKKSTPWTNPKNKAEQLARQAMKKAKEKMQEQFAKSENQKKVAMDVLESEEHIDETRSIADRKEPKSYLKGDSIRVPHKGKMITGKVIGHEPGSNQDPESYVVDVGEHGSIKVPVHKIDEAARVKIVRARIRGGKIQRRKRVSNVPGMTIRSGRLIRMSPAERRRRKMGQRRGKLKRRAKKSQMLRKRKVSLMKRSRLGI